MAVTQRIRVVGGVALAVAGFLLLFFSTRNAAQLTTQAQTGQNYTSTWEATKLITVDSAGGWNNVGILRNVPIGVAEWQVDARTAVGGAQLFTETWRTPTSSEIVYNPADQTLTGSGFNKADWIFANHVGVFGDTPDGGRVRYKFQSTSVLNPGYKYTHGNAKVGGNAIQCRSNSDSNCLMPRGSYGWEVYHALGNLGSDRGRISASGLMMPAKWIITGTIY